MVPSLAEVQRILTNLTPFSRVVLPINGCQDWGFYDLFELEASKSVLAEVARNLFVLEPRVA